MPCMYSIILILLHFTTKLNNNLIPLSTQNIGRVPMRTYNTTRRDYTHKENVASSRDTYQLEITLSRPSDFVPFLSHKQLVTNNCNIF